MVGFFSSRSASSHFCDSGKHFALSSSITHVRRSEMRRREVHCLDREADGHKSLFLSVSSLGFIREGHSSQQIIHQICDHTSTSGRVLLPGPVAIWGVAHP